MGDWRKELLNLVVTVSRAGLFALALHVRVS